MKKRILTLLLVVAMSVALVLTLTACGGDGTTTKVAYGYVYGLVGKAVIVYKGDTIIDAEIDEAVELTRVTVTTADGDYTIASGSNFIYKTIKWAGNTAVYHAIDATHEVAGYYVGDEILVDFVSHETEGEKRAEEYFKAAERGEFVAVTSTGDKPISPAVILKSLNSYWPSALSGGNLRRGWTENCRRLQDFVVRYGVGHTVTSFTANGTTTQYEITISGTVVSTGCSFSHFADYYKLFQAAAAK